MANEAEPPRTRACDGVLHALTLARLWPSPVCCPTHRVATIGGRAKRAWRKPSQSGM